MPCWPPLVIAALAWSLPLNYLRAEVQFVSRPLPVVKDMAAREGKLFFIHFTAQWCMPCRWMDENTFSDPALAGYVNANYIAVKMDIDEAYGLQCKEEFSVKILPTILVFNSLGELLDRREASLEPAFLLDVLQRHRQAQPSVTTYSAGLAPVYPQVPKSRAENIVPGALSRPALIPDEAPPVVQPVVVQAVSYQSAPVAQNQPESPGHSIVFTVQTGVFGDYGNALNEVNRMENLLRRPVGLTAVAHNGKTAYKITVGSFSSRQTAEDYLSYLRGRAISGFVRPANDQ